MFFDEIFAYMEKKQYLCIVFFMVLDLRLMKIGLSGDNPSFFLLVTDNSQSAAQKQKKTYCAAKQNDLTP